ncbi:MAG TPA: outer membrane protein assembly factor BamD [Vicinamibacteria bacterium]|nr:outer membrane protein assembly factor BamD [Vicinamibacteria bacterium]
MVLRTIGITGCLIGLVAAVGIWSCGGKSVDEIPRGAQGDARLMALGRQALDDKNWEEARSYFQQLLDAYPRSQLAGDARLGIADAYFNQKGSGNLILAIAEYRDFLTFYPNHPRADYAQYQIGYGHYRQIHSPDRDQDPTQLAIEEFEKLVELYRNSRYAEEGQKLLEECYEIIAESEFRVGVFYLEIRKHCRAAAARFEKVLESYPSFSKLDEVHFRLGSAYEMCGELSQALPHFQSIVDRYPNSQFREQAQSILAELSLANQTVRR